MRTRWAILGVFVFLVINYLLYMTVHPWWQEGFSPPGPGELTPVLLAIAFFVLLFALIGRRGRSFGAGFVAALLVLTVTSLGSCTQHWADPVDYLRRYNRQELNRRERTAKAIEQDRQWVDSIRAAGLTRGWGARRVMLLRACMERFALRDSTTRLLPPDSASLANQQGGCKELDAYSGRPRSGWHWRYTPPANGSGLLIEAYPEPVLGLDGPLYELNESGLLIQRERAGAPRMLVSSPIVAMHKFRECVEFRLAIPRPPGPRPWTRPSVYEMRTRDGAPPSCTELGEYPQQGVGAGDPNVLVAWLPLGVLPRDAALIYSLLYVPVGDGAREFDVHARPIFFPGGAMRSYLLTHAGTLHVTVENRAATATDAAPEACEVDLAVECGQ